MNPYASRFESIEACVFDAYGTLFDVHSAVSKLRTDVGPRHAELSELWRQKQLQYTWLRSLMNEHADFWQVTGDALAVAMDSVGIADQTLHDALMQSYLKLDAYPEVPHMLEMLRRAGMKTAILTNGSPKMIAAAVSSAGLEALIDRQLSVETVGIFKPARQVYQLAVDRLGVQPASISFQSSNAWDAAAARHFGFQVAWINRFSQPEERLPGGRPSAVLSDLSALPGLLGIC